MADEKRPPRREHDPSRADEIGATSGKTHDEVLSETLDPETARKSRDASREASREASHEVRPTGSKGVRP